MQVFFSNNITASTITIDGQENIHLTKVLRKSVGDLVFICNGKGLMVKAEIISSNKKQTLLKQHEIIAEQTTDTNKLILAVAPTKNIVRYEWMVEKCTEIGVNKILPFYSHHSERRRIKLERLRLIAIAAMKQSKSLFLPEILEPVSFKNFIIAQADIAQKFIAHMDESSTQISQLNELINKQNEVLLAIGPEGGFSDHEVEEGKKNGFSSISLGAKRLRTETAAMFSAAAYNLL